MLSIPGSKSNKKRCCSWESHVRDTRRPSHSRRTLKMKKEQHTAREALHATAFSAFFLCPRRAVFSAVSGFRGSQPPHREASEEGVPPGSRIKTKKSWANEREAPSHLISGESQRAIWHCNRRQVCTWLHEPFPSGSPPDLFSSACSSCPTLVPLCQRVSHEATKQANI